MMVGWLDGWKVGWWLLHDVFGDLKVCWLLQALHVFYPSTSELVSAALLRESSLVPSTCLLLRLPSIFGLPTSSTFHL